MNRGIGCRARVTWFFLVFSFFIVNLSVAGAETRQLRFFSMNLHCAEDDWKARVDQVIDAIVESDPDVIGLQEVCTNDSTNMPGYIVRNLWEKGYPVAFWRAVDTHGTFFVYQEQLMIVSKIPVTATKAGNLPFPFFRNKYVGIEIGGQWVVTTHLHLLFWQIRKLQIEKLLSIWSGKPVLMMGDFNANESSEEASPLRETGWQAYFAGNTFPSNKPDSSLDGFWVSPELGTRIRHVEARRLFEGAEFPLSDHLAVELNLSRSE